MNASRDTVSSVGIIRNKMLPYTAKGMKHVCFFRHALALDERRVKFLPEYAYSGATLQVPKTPSIALATLSKTLAVVGTTTSFTNHTKEVWFRGSHSDM